MQTKTQNSTQPVQELIKSLKRRLYFAYIIIAAVILIQAGSLIWSPAVSQASNELINSENKVIKTRGIIIVDEQGRERILLGAPIPAAKHRIRTDLAKVKAAWEGKLPFQVRDNFNYLEVYKTLNHNVNGMLVIDQNGYDRLAVGEQVPDPNPFKRNGASTGLVFNDENGFERGGLGVTKVKDKYRVVLGMDTMSDGKYREALDMFLIDDGPAGFSTSYLNNSTFMGYLPPKSFGNQTPDPFYGILMKQGEEVKYQVNTLQKK